MVFLRRSELSRRILGILLAAGCVAALLAGVFASRGRADNPPSSDSVGTIEGDSISVEGPMSVESVRGQVKTMLRSGSDVHIKSGQARIDLVEGGSITVCGPAHFSVLKSSGSLTVALDSGAIHAHIEGSLSLTVYTAQIQARSLAIGGGAQEILAGLDSSGAMCVRASKGAVRVEQQLTGQSVLIPQGGDVTLTNGQLESLHDTAGKCVCEMMPTTVVSSQVSGLASTEELKKKASQPKTTAAAPANAAAEPPQKTEEPVYQVFMPPLHYDASTKTQPEYDPKLIVLVRRARVRPTLIFQGKVEGDPVVAQVALPQPPLTSSQKTDPARKPEDDSTWNRVRSFFHKLWSPSS